MYSKFLGHPFLQSKKISDSCRGRAAWNKGITDTKTKTNGDIDGK